jgi:hypothetical protein
MAMSQRRTWQYCQVEVGPNNQGVLRQFFAERDPVEMQLYQNWPSMIGKLGDQGWEMVSAVPGVGGKNAVVYVFKRGMTAAVVADARPSQASQPRPADLHPAHEQDEQDDQSLGFEPLRGI